MPDLSTDLRDYLDALVETIDEPPAHELVPRQLEPRRSRRAMALATGLVAAAVVAIVALVVEDDRSDRVTTAVGPTTTTDDTSPAPPSTNGVGWVRMADWPGAGLVPRAGVWTGEEVVVFGGEEVINSPERIGYDLATAYDPETDRWRTLSSPPAPLRSPVSVWTGTQVITIGLDGSVAALDPAADEWAVLSSAPAPVRLPVNSHRADHALWLDGEVILPAAGLALDPIADDWRTFDAPPSFWRTHGAARLGSDLVLIGSDRVSESAPAVLRVFALRDGSDEWVEIAAPDLPGAAVSVAADPEGGIVLVSVDSTVSSARLDDMDSTWVPLSGLTPQTANCLPMVIGTDAQVMVDVCTAVATLDGTEWTEHTSPVTDGPLPVMTAGAGESAFFVGEESWMFTQPPTLEESVSIQGEWRRLPSTMSGGSELSPFVAMLDENRALVLSLENGGGLVAGEILDLNAGTVEQLASSPLVWRVFAMIGRTGEEVIATGGSNGPGIDVSGAANNPETDTWRLISDPPGFVPDVSENQAIGPGAWTGTELISWRSGLA